MPPATLNLLVLYASDLEQTARFYAALGLELIAEQHGSGPRHYACTCGTLVLEIYPARADEPERAGGMLGFGVADLAPVLAALATQSAPVLRPPTLGERGLRCVVQDPDGRRVELIAAILGTAA